jgi:hypothetical protein
MLSLLSFLRLFALCFPLSHAFIHPCAPTNTFVSNRRFFTHLLAESVSDPNPPPFSASEDAATSSPTSSPNQVVVIGGGWGGWGAAKRLCEYYKGSDTKVTLIDALPDPTGATPYLSPNGKPVEAGTRGFWYDYPNINK